MGNSVFEEVEEGVYGFVGAFGLELGLFVMVPDGCSHVIGDWDRRGMRYEGI